MSNLFPVLYSFRRCPYAIRARMAIAVSQQRVELREVDLKKKPRQLLECSPKATVPVLQLPAGQVLDESLDIMHWALTINDPQNWLQTEINQALIDENDGNFKAALDRYKYADRYPEFPLTEHRRRACLFPQKINGLLSGQSFFGGDSPSWVDVAIFPFIRQFAFVDKDWFDNQSWANLQKWLDFFLTSEVFLQVMKKQKVWVNGDEPLLFSCGIVS